MNSVIIRFYLVNKKTFFETAFDERLTFNENFTLFSEIYPISIDKYYIYDDNRKAFISKNVPLKKLMLSKYSKLYLF